LHDGCGTRKRKFCGNSSLFIDCIVPLNHPPNQIRGNGKCIGTVAMSSYHSFGEGIQDGILWYTKLSEWMTGFTRAARSGKPTQMKKETKTQVGFYSIWLLMAKETNLGADEWTEFGRIEIN